MVKKQDINKIITNRVLKFVETAIHTGLIGGWKEVAKIAGITATNQIYAIKSTERTFTVEQLHNIALHFNLDMNHFFFGIGTPILETNKKQSLTDKLREVIISLDAEEQRLLALNKSRNNKKSNQGKL